MSKIGSHQREDDGFQEIARGTLESSSDTLTVDNIPPRKYLKIIYKGLITGTALDTTMRVNDDSGTNYNYGGTVDATFWGLDSGTNGGDAFMTIEISNHADRDKLGFSTHIEAEVNADSTAGTMRHYVFKWNNSSDQIEKLEITNTGASTSFAAGSEIIVLGMD